jgi:AraC family transcriptional regulator
VPVPESTSAEAFKCYVGGQVLVACRGQAWRDIKAWIIAPPRSVEMVSLPAVSEPFLAWSVSGEAEFQEREGKDPWVTHRISKGSFFPTSGGAPYDCRWKAVGNEPFQSMAVFIALPLLQRALEEVFGDAAPRARLRDLSAFHDPALNSLMERVQEELLRRHASALFLQGIAQAIAIHLARNYAGTDGASRRGSPSLPGYKLRQITDWLAEHVAEEFNLDRLAAQAGLSKFAACSRARWACRRRATTSACGWTRRAAGSARRSGAWWQSRWTWATPIPAISRNSSAGKPAWPRAITAGKGEPRTTRNTRTIFNAKTLTRISRIGANSNALKALRKLAQGLSNAIRSKTNFQFSVEPEICRLGKLYPPLPLLGSCRLCYRS